MVVPRSDSESSGFSHCGLANVVYKQQQESGTDFFEINTNQNVLQVFSEVLVHVQSDQILIIPSVSG